ncbi:carboxypeptidase-like regulatory domain-containing protein [Croceimicrobium hydrocarbonivorans]|uniref:Carboxypeptidase-like regulatory domain-containing protein n=1 Tax=Croceimicrobium hydrocarbonivorans TaxID=2761580 RepID=A0A7H0VIW3_9FLAO|nr:carboxypeptidase-like regulatory domain-containing protein [Croceimicrobium hydrocarbonivorans]QNR25661.1 carboxypeptidase-like regulatory domain-containing protein [Croceimicrobium hydrocarbonivorans]
MRKFLLLILSLLLLLGIPLELSSQSHSYQAIVLDKSTNESLPYVNVRVYQGDSTFYFSATDVQGRFIIKRGFPIGTQISVSCMGYSTKNFPLVFSEALDTIFLEPDPMYLNEVTVMPIDPQEAEYFETGTYRKSEDIYICRRPGNRSAVLLEPDEDVKQGILWRFGLLISESSKGEHPFRIFFCEVSDASDQRPGKIIAGSEIKALSQDQGGWLYFDLDSLRIPFSSKGLYAVIEWLPEQTPELESFSNLGRRRLEPINHFCLAEHHCKFEDYLGWYQRPGDFEGWRRLKERKDFLVANPIVYANVLVIE